MQLIRGKVYLYAVFMICCTPTTNCDCFCPDHTTWMYPVVHHEFCGKELSGKDCKENAFYNCTKGKPVAVYWELCKQSYKDPYCTPKLKSDCPYRNQSFIIECMTQRTCVNKVTADDTMREIYGKTTLLPRKS